MTKGIAFAGRSNDGIALPVTVNNKGNLEITQKANNHYIAGTIFEGEDKYLNLDATDYKAIMIGVGEGIRKGSIRFKFEHYQEGLGWMEWRSGSGESVEIKADDVNGGIAFGPIHGFPMFEKGRILISGGGKPNVISRSSGDNETPINYYYPEEFIYLPDQEHDEQDASNVFDGIVGSLVRLQFVGQDPVWVEFEDVSGEVVNKVRMLGREGSSTVGPFEILASDSKESAYDDWDVIAEGTGLNTSEWQEVKTTATKPYRYYRVAALSRINGSYANVRIPGAEFLSGDTSCQVSVQGVL